MLSRGDIKNISECFGALYGVDIEILEEDANNLKTAISERTKQGESSYEIYSNIVTPSKNRASSIIPDLETFEYSEVIPDGRLKLAHIEQNLDEAVRYAENCLQMRRQYSEMGKLRNDTRFKFEEFVRLDWIHMDEVAAGLYELPKDEAEAERGSFDASLTQANLRLKNIEELIKSTLSPEQIAAFVANESFVAANTANHKPDEVTRKSHANADDRMRVETASWQQARSNSDESVSHARIRLAAAEKKVSYLSKDVSFRTCRTAVSRNLAWLQIAEHCRENSPVNYEERLEHQRLIFSDNLRHLVERVIVLEVGLKEYYGIEIKLTIPKKGKILDDVARWLIEVQDELSKHKIQETVVTCPIFTSGPITIVKLPEGEIIAQNSFEVELYVKDSDLPNSRSFLRGVNLEFFGALDKPISLEIIPPPEAKTGASESTGGGGVRFGRVCPFAAALNMQPQQIDVFWNGRPQGMWKLRGTYGGGSHTIDGLVMHLWIATISE